MVVGVHTIVAVHDARVCCRCVIAFVALAVVASVVAMFMMLCILPLQGCCICLVVVACLCF